LDDKKTGGKKIRGCYVSVDDVALFYLRDLIDAVTVMDIQTGAIRRKDLCSSSPSSSPESSEDTSKQEFETVEQMLKNIPKIIQGIDVVYYQGSDKETTVAPEGIENDDGSLTPLIQAKNVYEDIMRTPMMRANDVYCRLLKEASIHRQRYIFGLLACLEPYIPDSLLVYAVRNVQKRVARDFKGTGQAPTGTTMLPGCIFVKGKCVYWDEVKRVRKQFKDQKREKENLWNAFCELSNQWKESARMNQQYAEMSDRLLKDKEEYGRRITELQDCIKMMKTSKKKDGK
jgi:uncharacterized protein YjiS (DUF1127 family)